MPDLTARADHTARAVTALLGQLAENQIYITPGLDLLVIFNEAKLSIDHNYYTRDPWAWEKDELLPLDVRRDQYRRLKALFGPFHEQGAPPYVVLCAERIYGIVKLRVVIYDAFACEKVGTKKVQVSESQRKYYETEAARLAGKAQETEEEEPVFSCTPKFPKEIEP